MSKKMIFLLAALGLASVGSIGVGGYSLVMVSKNLADQEVKRQEKTKQMEEANKAKQALQAEISKLASLLNTQITQNQDLSLQIQTTRKDLNFVNENLARIDKLEVALRKIEAMGVSATATPAADLPKQFKETFAYLPTKWTNEQGNEVVYGGHEESFDMVLIPADAEKGIESFYIGTTEITWQLFEDFAFRMDISSAEASELQEKQLRPSQCYPDCVQVQIKKPNRPATGLTRATAEAFCKFLSERTGRMYRLPTMEEWKYVYEKGETDPGDEEGRLAAGWFSENSMDMEELFMTRTQDSASLAPNKLGVYDMLGNAAEWVMTTDGIGERGDGTIIVGGSYDTSVSEFSTDWQKVCSQAEWNLTYPQTPKSMWWFKDRVDMGFRVVCEAINIPESK